MYNLTQSPDGTLIYTSPAGVAYTAGGHDANCTISTCPVEISVYGYRASLPFSALLIGLFMLCAAGQTYLGLRYKTWTYMSAMLLGCICEVLGYAGRIMMWENPWNNTGFIMQIGAFLTLLITNKTDLAAVCITIGPVFFSAAIYVMLFQM